MEDLMGVFLFLFIIVGIPTSGYLFYKKTTQGCFFHKYSTWEKYVISGSRTPVGIIYPKSVRGKSFDFCEERQKRQCSKCNYEQDIEIT